jgi:NitT/TauT family transport system substrate-binding protein
MKRIFFLCFLLALCFSLSADDRTVQILAPKSTSSIPLLEVERRDEQSDILPGVEIEIELFANPAQALARLLNGEIELLYTGSSVGWGNHLNGGPVVMIRTGVWGVSSIVGLDADYTGIEDLKNRTIALPFPGAPLDVQMRYIFSENGIDPDNDLQIVYTPFPQAAGQILSGQVDAAPLPEPLATNLIAGKGLVRYVKVQDAWAEVRDGDPMSPQVALFTTAETLPDLDELLPPLIAEWTEASDSVSAAPGHAGLMYSGRLGFPSEIVATAIGNTIYAVPNAEDNKARVLGYIELLYGGEEEQLPEDEFFVDF